MLLGKRPRPPMRRTTSMTGITVDMSNVEDQQPTDVHAAEAAAAAAAAMVEGPQQGPAAAVNNNNNNTESTDMKNNNFGYHEQHHFLAMLSPRNSIRTNSAALDVVETAHFLRTCGLCKRHLASGCDIYMYRGDTPFCSLECREQQMKHDERVEKYKAVASKKDDRHASRSTSTNSKASGKSQTVAAA